MTDPTPVEHSVTVTSRMALDKVGHGRVSTILLTKGERIGLGLRAIFICYVITVWFVFIPLLHFFLVPAGIILGIALFISQYGYRERILSGTVSCPNCTKSTQLRTGPSDWPIKSICAHCRSELHIEKKII